MDNRDCVAFLQWALPRLGLRWRGYRRVRGRVCKRIARRLRELGLPDLDVYRAYLAAHPGEWLALDARCSVTISRFWRDHRTFEALAGSVLPALAARARGRGDAALRAWSAGCASGEEAYTLAILWELRPPGEAPGVDLHVVGTDVDPVVVARARRGVYPPSSLREVPADVRESAFALRAGEYRVADRFRAHVTFAPRDVRSDSPDDPFDVVLCRNLAFTYFEPEVQRAVLRRLAARLRPGGALVVGAHEVPPDDHAFVPWLPAAHISRKTADRSTAGISPGGGASPPTS